MIAPTPFHRIRQPAKPFAIEPALAPPLSEKGLANAARFHRSRTAAQVTEVYEKAAPGR